MPRQLNEADPVRLSGSPQGSTGALAGSGARHPSFLVSSIRDEAAAWRASWRRTVRPHRRSGRRSTLIVGVAVMVALASAEYTVENGDTLGRIAARHDTTVAALVEANGISNPNRIRIVVRISRGVPDGCD